MTSLDFTRAAWNNGTELRKCPYCHDGVIDIPHWYADVESWERVGVPCPVCDGHNHLSAEDWDMRQQALDAHDESEVQP